MMLSKNTKVKVSSTDGDTDFFDIAADVLHGDTLASYLSLISQNYVLRASIDVMKENGFILRRGRRRRYSAQYIRDADHADDITLQANTPTLLSSVCSLVTIQSCFLQN